MKKQTEQELRAAGRNEIAALDLTARKRAAERDRLAAIVDDCDDAIISKSLDGTITAWNRAAETIFGYSAEEVVGKPIRMLMVPGREQEESEILARVGRGESVVHFETVRVRKDGKEIDVSVTVSPIRDSSGAIVGASKVARDISERNRMERALQESQEQYRTLFNEMLMGFALLEPICDGTGKPCDFRYMDVNPAHETLTGLRRDQVIAKTIREVLPTLEPVWFETLGKVAITGESIHFDSYAKPLDKWFELTAFCTRKNQVGVTFTDITKRKRVEAEMSRLNLELEEHVRHRTAQLDESERRVRRKLESILSPERDLGNLELEDILDVPAVQLLVEDFQTITHLSMAVIDVKGKMLAHAGFQDICSKFHRVCPEACQNCHESDMQLSSGVTPGEFKIYKCKNNLWDVATPIMVGGQHMGNLFVGQFFFPGEAVDYDLFRAQAQEYGFDEIEYLKALDQVPRVTWEALDASMTFLAKMAAVLARLSYSGIKLARSMAETTRANSELAASIKELQTFTYSVSHDLRAPLRHIGGYSRLLAEEYGATLAPEAQKYLARIETGARRMGLMVDDLLNLAQVGRRELSLCRSDLRGMVEEVITELEPESEGRQIEWHIGDLPCIECDPGLLRLVFQNLLSNAIKFTRPRARAVIEVGQRSQNGRLILHVRDNGVGFDMKYSHKLFGVFQRLHPTEDFEGTGVGLATVQRIVQKHGGRIWAEAERDKGATFYFTLEACEGAATITNAASA